MMAWGRLLRISLFATAVCDVVGGSLLASGGVLPSWPRLAAVLFASLAIFHGNLAFNDWCDREADARAGRLSTEHLRQLAALEAHPANAAFDELADAKGADISGARWSDVGGQPVTAFELPVPRYVELWNGVRGRIAGSVFLHLRGDRTEARRRLATVVRLGELMYQDGPLVLDGVLGARIADEGRAALASLDVPAWDALPDGTVSPASVKRPHSPDPSARHPRCQSVGNGCWPTQRP